MMESKFLCIQLLVILCFLLSYAHSGVLNKNEYVKEELMPFAQVDKTLLQSPLASAKDCCVGCLFIEGIGCIDPNDGTIRPKLLELLRTSNLARPREECCSGCLYIEGIGCIDPNDGSIHPYRPPVKESSEVVLRPRDRCCSRCIYIPGRGCVDPSDPGVHPPSHG